MILNMTLNDEYLYNLQEDFRDYCSDILGDYWFGIEMADECFDKFECQTKSAIRIDLDIDFSSLFDLNW